MGSVHASDFGVTSVIVEDMRVAGNLQISTIHVVSPEELCLHLVLVDSLYNPIDGSVNSITTPLWYVVTGRFYIIHVKALLREPMQEIHLTKVRNVLVWHFIFTEYMCLSMMKIENGYSQFSLQEYEQLILCWLLANFVCDNFFYAYL